MPKIKKIQIPFSLIVDTDTEKIPYNAVYLYMMLKMVCVNNHVKIYAEKFRGEDYLDWKSTKTFKKYLEYLKEKGYIRYEFVKIPSRKPMELDIIAIKDLPQKNHQFVQVNINVIKKIIKCAKNTPIIVKKDLKETKKIADMKEMAIKLYYYYIKLFNKSLGYAYPSYENINELTGISKINIISLNDMFIKNSIMNIEYGKYYAPEDPDNNLFKKESNKYRPLEVASEDDSENW